MEDVFKGLSYVIVFLNLNYLLPLYFKVQYGSRKVTPGKINSTVSAKHHKKLLEQQSDKIFQSLGAMIHSSVICYTNSIEHGQRTISSLNEYT